MKLNYHSTYTKKRQKDFIKYKYNIKNYLCNLTFPKKTDISSFSFIINKIRHE